MLKVEVMPPAPISGEKGASEGRDKGRLRGDSPTQLDSAGVAAEPESLSKAFNAKVAGEAVGLGDVRLPEAAAALGLLEEEESVGTGDTHTIGELEGEGESHGIGDAAGEGDATATGMGEAEERSSTDGRDGREAGEEEEEGSRTDGRDGRETGEEKEPAAGLLVPLTKSVDSKLVLTDAAGLKGRRDGGEVAVLCIGI